MVIWFDGLNAGRPDKDVRNEVVVDAASLSPARGRTPRKALCRPTVGTPVAFSFADTENNLFTCFLYISFGLNALGSRDWGLALGSIWTKFLGEIFVNSSIPAVRNIQKTSK